MHIKETIVYYLPKELNTLLENFPHQFFETITEIRLRTDKPLIFVKDKKEYTINSKNELETNLEDGFVVTPKLINSFIELISSHSLYAFEEELKNGYITIQGGHRIGICGKGIIEKGEIKSLKNISSVNMRICHEIKGSATKIMTYLVSEKPLNTMIISPPASGKTTVLRDIIRQFSNGAEGLVKPQNVGVVDERSELAGSFLGVSQNDLGIRTDILDGCPKDKAMMMLLRSMSPNIIAVDEIGKKSDIKAVEEVVNGGITVICTVHGKDLEDISIKPEFKKLLKKNIFKRFVFIENQGQVHKIFDENFINILREG